jgi:hypothetical protein
MYGPGGRATASKPGLVKFVRTGTGSPRSCRTTDCTEQPAADLPALPSGAGGSAAANAGAPPPPPPARSQDTGSGTLVLPQLYRLHEAYKQRQVAPPASSISQDQQPTASGPIPSQRRLTQQLTAHWPEFKILRQRYAGTRFEEQSQLHMPQKHKATVPDSALRMEMNALETQADNDKARDLHWKPLSCLGTLRPSTANDAWDQPYFCLCGRRSSARHWVWRCRYSPPSPAATNARPPCAAARSTAWTY